MSSKLFWAPPSFERPTLLSTFLRNQLLWALFWVFFSFGQFLEPSLEQGENWGHSFEHSKECTYSQEPFFEWVYSRECSFGRFLEGSRSTRTLMLVLATSITISLCADCHCLLQELTCTSQNSVRLAPTLPHYSLLALASRCSAYNAQP